jgi:diaminohydroxyphosphoribosylaminopyrimidine deaminase/5-amino-6-(5-phosphoribosylamino)uracil reductase
MTALAFMGMAAGLARRGLGSCWPNPSVGCVLVSDGVVVGRGRTGVGGRPHAETVALAMAGEAARGATAYVTLEPCSHVGQTPPCADALVAAGVAKVVVACGDPDPRVDGRGIARLRAAGIEVETGVLAAEASETLAGFFTRVKRGRPLLTLKLASTLDGRIATRAGESQWITGLAARKTAHRLRGEHDACMVGVGTVLSDDPDLTCRIEGFAKRPMVRVVADSHARTPLLAQIVATCERNPTWVLHRDGADPARIAALTALGVRCMQVGGSEAGIDLHQAMEALGASGLTRVMVEGGAQLAGALLRAGLVDRLAWFHAPSVMGGDGYPAAAATGISALADMPRFRRVAVRPVGDDLLSEFEICDREKHGI